MAEARSIAANRQTSCRGEYVSTQRNSAKTIRTLSRNAEKAQSNEHFRGNSTRWAPRGLEKTLKYSKTS